MIENLLSKMCIKGALLSKYHNIALKVHFMILTYYFLWHSLAWVDINKISLFPNFHLILNLHLWVMHVSMSHTVAIGNYAGNYHVDYSKPANSLIISPNKMNLQEIFHTQSNIMYLKVSTDEKNLNFLVKNEWMKLWIRKWAINNI